MAHDKELSNMLDNLVQNKPEQARVNFHTYLQTKLQDMLKDKPQPVEQEEKTKE